MIRPHYPSEVKRSQGPAGAPVYVSRLVRVTSSTSDASGTTTLREIITVLYRLEVESFGQRWRSQPSDPLAASELEWRALEVHDAIARRPNPEAIAAELADRVRGGEDFDKAAFWLLGILPAGPG